MSEGARWIAHRYEVLRPLGRGGLGAAFAVRDHLFDVEVALKLVDGARAEQLQHEFGWLRGLWHPHLGRALDFGYHDGKGYFTSELIEGVTLDAVDEDLIARTLELLDGLEALHAAGLRHGDLKPANVMVGSGGAVLIDLSCAYPIDAQRPPVMGTRGFIAPELLHGEAVDVRADLYGLGKTLEALEQLPPRLNTLVSRLVAVSPDARPADIAEVRASLDPERRTTFSFVRRPAKLIGREATLSRARALMERWQAGAEGPRALQLEGPPGVGGTRMVEELTWFAQRELGAEVHVARADMPGGLGDALSRASGERVRDLPHALELVVRLAAREQLLLLVLDDAHRLSPPDVPWLTALYRTLPDRGRLALLTRTLGDGDDEPTVHREVLSPLARIDVASWVGDRPEVDVTRLHRTTGGFPRALVNRLEGTPDPSARFGRLAASAQETLVAVTLGASPTDDDLAALVHDGWIAMDAHGARPLVEAESLRALAPPHIWRAAARRAARECHRPGRRAWLWWEAGDEERALILFDETAHRPADDWKRLARMLGRARPLEAAAVLVDAGDAKGALSLLAAHLRRHPEARAQVASLAAAAYLAHGDLPRAKHQIARAGVDARSCDRAARIALRTGDPAAAYRWAERGLAQDGLDDALRADLLDDLGTAASYRGQAAAAVDHLAQAASLHASGGRARAQARSLCYQGIAAFRAGDPETAAGAFRDAMDVARGATDLWIYAAQNEGAARHQLGDLGAARRAYEASLRVTVALGHRGASVGLRANLAKLYADAGAMTRALEAGREAERAAMEQDAALFAASAAAAIADALRFSDPPAAEASLTRAVAHLGQDHHAHARERAELSLQAAALDLDRGRTDGAAQRLDTLTRGLDEDVAARRSHLEARLAAARGNLSRAIERAEASLTSAEARGLRLLAAEVRGTLAELLERSGADALAQRHRQEARLVWERAVATLPAGWHPAFWRHPSRMNAAAPPSAGPSSHGPALTGRAMRRVLAINQKLSASHDPNQILTLALDSALELTGGERGFVLVDRGGELEVAVARNVDPEGDTHFSRSIAARALASGRPVTSVDAGRDERFREEASVHAIRLLSVVAVPIRAQEGLIGVVYLDHRYQRGRFDEQALDVLIAIADQVAIALTNARLVMELEARNQELDRRVGGQRRELRRLRGEVRAQRAALGRRYDFSSIIGESAALQRVFDVLDRVVDTDLPVLIEGESGTGKEVVARAIHHQGPRADGPMVSINCGALSETLLTSELFGHTKGAFTGADAAREGLFVAARGGTLFLDELGEMPLSMQVKLLRALQEKEVIPLGANQPIPVDVRILAATNRRLRQEVAAGRFREDLYYRIGVVSVALPPLRERREDIPLLAAHLLQRAAQRTGREEPRLSSRAVDRLLAHDWPGNVRELENVLTQAVVLCRAGQIETDDLRIHQGASATPSPVQPGATPEQQEILAALERHRWNITKTARELGISRPTLYRKMDRYGLRD